MAEGNGWSEYQRLVLSEIHELKEDTRALRDSVAKMQAELSALQVKAGVWGGLAGLIPFGVFLLTSRGVS